MVSKLDVHPTIDDFQTERARVFSLFSSFIPAVIYGTPVSLNYMVPLKLEKSEIFYM
jgi:hypothetical protein